MTGLGGSEVNEEARISTGGRASCKHEKGPEELWLIIFLAVNVGGSVAEATGDQVLKGHEVRR